MLRPLRIEELDLLASPDLTQRIEVGVPVQRRRGACAFGAEVGIGLQDDRPDVGKRTLAGCAVCSAWHIMESKLSIHLQCVHLKLSEAQHDAHQLALTRHCACTGAAWPPETAAAAPPPPAQECNQKGPSEPDIWSPPSYRNDQSRRLSLRLHIWSSQNLFASPLT